MTADLEAAFAYVIGGVVGGVAGGPGGTVIIGLEVAFAYVIGGIAGGVVGGVSISGIGVAATARLKRSRAS